MKLNEYLKTTRQKKNITQKKLAEMVNTHPQNISNIERGEALGLQLCIAIGDALEIKRIALYRMFMNYKKDYYKKVFGV